MTRQTFRSLAGAALIALSALGPPQHAHAEQKQMLGTYEGHYSLVPTTFLTADVAADYGIIRSRDRALLNVSVIDPRTGPVSADVSGTVRDLLGSARSLAFEEVKEGPAVYYLATVRHDDEDVLRFAIDIRTPDGASHRLAFQQKVYWENR